MRIRSDKPHTIKGGETGYFHPITDDRRPTKPVEKKRPDPVINVGKLMNGWRGQTRMSMVEALAEDLSVAYSALSRLECAWATNHRAWAFPMFDGYGNRIGIRLRTPDGNKYAVRGSQSGIFYPDGPAEGIVMICEGPTDTAAALTLGYFALGRPSCSGGIPHLQAAIRRLRISRVVIVADVDGPGMDGAANLEPHLRVPTCIVPLPAKDLREFVRLGGTRELLESLLENRVWNNH